MSIRLLVATITALWLFVQLTVITRRQCILIVWCCCVCPGHSGEIKSGGMFVKGFSSGVKQCCMWYFPFPFQFPNHTSINVCRDSLIEECECALLSLFINYYYMVYYVYSIIHISCTCIRYPFPFQFPDHSSIIQ